MEKILKKLSLPFCVFVTGAAVLVIEIVAIRLFSPHYGNTIFTVSGVLTLILTALSIGYYGGGKIADRYPLPAVFFGLILSSGALLMGFHFLGMLLLPLLGNILPVTTGPLISAFLLFFFPSLLLGTLSPFAIKLQTIQFPEDGIGAVSGIIFFWSTFGSIAGSLLASFFLIPHFGINEIFIATAAILFTLGLVPLLFFKIQKKAIRTLTFVFLGLLAASVLFASLEDGRALYSKDGIYEKILIYDSKFEGRPARFFKQDKSYSGVMFLDTQDPKDLPDVYPRYYTLYKLFNPDIRDTLVIGGGIHTVPKALLAEHPAITVDVLEIEPALHSLAQKYFNLPDDPRLTHITDDGRRHLRQTDKFYDYIFSDVYYSLFSIPAHFTTKEFFQTAKDKLNNNGVFAANLIGDLSRQDPSFIMSEIKTFRSVFPNTYVFALSSPATTGMQNFLLVGHKSDRRIDFQSGTLAQTPEMEIFKKKYVDLSRFDLTPYTIISDNFAPVEFLARGIFKKAYASTQSKNHLDGDEMLALIAQQLRYGPRHPGTQGHEDVKNFIASEMRAVTPNVQTQSFPYNEYTLTNIIGRLYPERERRIILATHYDSKKFADRDKKHKEQPVPGANDSASGVAVLLSIARVLGTSEKTPDIGIDFVFFDGEEGPPDLRAPADWTPLGSTYFAENLDAMYPGEKPVSAVVLDMVCDKNLKIHKEISSVRDAPQQVEQFWNIARRVNPKVFRNSIKYEILDDHTPLNKAGIPSILVIDPKYGPFHTTKDTLDQCSGESLKTVAYAVWSYAYAAK